MAVSTSNGFLVSVVQPSANTVVPAVYPLELLAPRAAGTAPSTDANAHAMPSGHRIFKAYPGIPYNIRAAVLGGSYPFTFSLSNAPSGMTIHSRTGEIQWPNPQADATPTITVTDAEGTVSSSSWAITVGTSGFKFVDAANGNDANDGSIGAPWRTLSKVHTSSLDQIVYFRAGTYNFDGIARSPYNAGIGGPDHYIATWRDVSGASVQLLAYPGDEGQVIFDHGGTSTPGEQGVMVEIQSAVYGPSLRPIYIDGIHTRNVDNCLWRMQINGSYHTYRRCTFSHIYRPEDGANPGGIMHVQVSGDLRRQYCVYQDNRGENNKWTGYAGAGLFKFYGLNKFLIENCEIVSGGIGDAKANNSRFEYRGNWIHDNTCIPSVPYERDEMGVHGNMNLGPHNGEIRYNRITDRGSPNRIHLSNQFPGYGGEVCSINSDNNALQIDVYRNTFVGKVIVLSDCTGGNDGPFKFHNNVIINDNQGVAGYDGGVTFHYPATGPSVTQLGTGADANLTGTLAAGIVNDTPTTGDLSLRNVGTDPATQYRSLYLGKKGHETP